MRKLNQSVGGGAYSFRNMRIIPRIYAPYALIGGVSYAFYTMFHDYTRKHYAG